MNTSSKTGSTGKSTPKTSPFGVLFNGVFLASALGHFSVDLLNGTRATLLTFISPTLGLSNAALGTVSTIYVWASAATQPVFGWLADRIGARWLAALGILWMFAFFALSMLTSGALSVVFLIFGSLGSAAFHPAGTMESTLVGRELYAGRETTAASFFFFFGQFGLFLGPVVSGILLDRFGLSGLLALATILLPISLNAGWQFRHRHLAHAAHKAAEAAAPRIGAGRRFVFFLALVGALQAWAQQNMITFVPKYLADLGQSPAVYGLVSGLFMGGSAFGNVLGGNLADKFGKQRVAMVMLLLASIPLFIVSQIGWSGWLYLLVPLAGFFTGSVHSIVVVLAQRALPLGMATASGLTLGFIFSAGALGTLLSGPLADTLGWPPVFLLTGGLALTAAGASLFLREKHRAG
jgi:FSR family fosmidomycin resistance protein-like MFS transporter